MKSVYKAEADMFTILLIALIRALRFKPEAIEVKPAEKVEFDREKAVCALREMVQIPTVSYTETEKEDAAAFEAFVAKLKELFPEVHARLESERVPPKGLLYRWRGKSRKIHVRKTRRALRYAQYHRLILNLNNHIEKPAFRKFTERRVFCFLTKIPYFCVF